MIVEEAGMTAEGVGMIAAFVDVMAVVDYNFAEIVVAEYVVVGIVGGSSLLVPAV